MYTLFHEIDLLFRKKNIIFKLFVSWISFFPKMFSKTTKEPNSRAHVSQQLFINLKSPCGKNDFNEYCAIFKVFNFSHV